MILYFKNPNYEWMSNMYASPMVIDGKQYATVEHYFQSMKTTVPEEAEAVRLAATPYKAKRMGKKVTLRPDWQGIKYDIMLKALRVKFSDPILAKKLKDTGDEKIVENSPYDVVWGSGLADGIGIGSNLMGKALEEIRRQL